MVIIMNILLIFFALPIATIILAAVLEKVLNCPFAVAAVAFAIYLIVTFAAFDETFLIATIVYTILAFLTALFIRFIKNLFCNNENSNNLLLTALEAINANNTNNTNNNGNGNSNANNSNNNNCGCGCRRRRF